jgi:hypothetical protein
MLYDIVQTFLLTLIVGATLVFLARGMTHWQRRLDSQQQQYQRLLDDHRLLLEQMLTQHRETMEQLKSRTP